ncbi:serine/threonine-protein kinase [Rhodococcus opacus]|uniref:Serine/threonine-protein kinase PknK n=1 Tax=Rhodococcus opacus TaxID=37919 RepID=A0A076F097_RHOOP|nr:serine/threonine-protein kinase [Rhodococcus opacus]AII10852.1 protein kinase [Rhodococcus opacus]
MTDRDRPAPLHGVSPELKAELQFEGLGEVDEIGRGGFGVVYRCREPSLQRTVAVKVLSSALDQEGYARFLREQRAMGQLSGHPNIVNVLRIGTTSTGRPFIVMQYHQRGSLDAAVRRRGPMAWGTAVRIAVKLAGALETAHRAGILHRDVKPGNVLLTDYEEPQLSDFGIARIAGGFETDTGTITGSPAFTAPEVLSGEPPTVASDVYGLGSTLFCLITGHAAFERRSGEQIIAQFLRIASESAPSLPAAGLPSDVRAAVESAMARDPDRRPSTAAEFGNQLREIERAHGLVVDEMALATGEDDARSAPIRSEPVGTVGYVPTGVHEGLGRDDSVGTRLRPPSALTKYRPPTPTRVLVVRTRLADRLQDAGRRRLILIHAPAGFGKSTLAAQWREILIDDGVVVAWLSVDADDNNVVWFLAHLVEAIRRVRTDLASDLGQVLEDRGNQAGRYVLTTLLNEIHDRGELLTVVVDDWHRVSDPETVAAMEFLLEHGCHHLQVMVTSRTQSGLPLSRMRVRDELVEVDSTALRFDIAESRQFLVDLGGLSLGQQAITDLCNSTEGWVAALQLASLSLRGREDPTEFIGHLSGRHRGIAEYLVENVLGTLEPDILDFMLATSVTERLCGDLAAELARVDNGQAFLEQIEERDLFLRALDDEREWFRYHHLFADFLRRRLERDHPERVAALHRTASRWFADHDLLSEAVDQSLAAGDQERAADLVDGLALIEHSQIASVLGLIDKLPATLVAGRPHLLIAAAWAHVLLHHHRAVIDQTFDALNVSLAALPDEEGPTTDLRVEAALVKGIADLFGDRIDGLLDLVSDCVARQKTLRPFALAAAANVASYEAIHRFQFDAARRWQEWAEPFHARTTGPFSAVYGYCFAGIAALEMLRIDEAERYFRRAYELARRSGGPRSYSTRLTSAMLGDLLYEQGHVDEAERLLDESYQLGSEGGVVDFVLVTYGTGARIKAIGGDLEAASRRLDEGAEIAAALSLPRLAARIENERARWGLRPTDRPPARREAAAAAASSTVNGILEMTAELDEDTAIRTLLNETTPHSALEALERASALATRVQSHRRPRAALRVGLLEVTARLAAYGEQDAAAALVPLAVRCAQLGLIRPLCDEGATLTQLVASLRERLVHNQWPSEWPTIDEPFLSAVLASAEQSDPPSSSPSK